MVAPAVAQYPEGARRLKGSDREYIVAPLMNIIEEAYTVYFDFQQPSNDEYDRVLAGYEKRHSENGHGLLSKSSPFKQ